MDGFKGEYRGLVEKYADTFRGIGGKVFLVDDMNAVKTLVSEQYDVSKRIVTTLTGLSNSFEMYSAEADPHSFEDVELALIEAHFVVAENGATWLTEERMGHRILPYICQHLAVVVKAENILPTLHEAYTEIGEGQYGFGAFISGPSKTADIEQALVMGAHGPISMTVFIIQ